LNVWARLGLATAAGGLAALGFAPFDLWPLTIAAIAALLALLDAARTRRGAFATGWWFGVGHFFVGLTWIAHAFTYQDAMPASLGWVAVGGLSMFLALDPGLAALLAWSAARTPLARALMLVPAWMLGEWLRGWVLSGFAWNPLGGAWLTVPLMPDAAAWIGALGLSALIVLAGGALRLATLRRWRAASAGTVAVVAIGLATLTRGEPAPTAAAPMVYIVQPDIGQEERWDPSAEERHLARQLALTRAALGTPAGRAPALVIWSESSIQGLVEDDPALRSRLASVLAPGDLLLFGGVAVQRRDGAMVSATNSVFILDARARLLGRYDKSHLVPLGEYVPARGLMTALGLARLAPGDLDFLGGRGPTTFPLPDLPDVGIVICYEIIFPHAVVDPEHRPAWLLQPSNDSWYGLSMQPQHLAQARLRAIEEGLPVARATPTGISALIDARGRVVRALGPHAAGVITAPLPPPLPPTPFARFGHWTSFPLGLILAALGLWASRRRI